MSEPSSFSDLVHLMARLRAPDGCPWDRKQTHQSLKPYLLEETYEVLEAIERGDHQDLREELGDLLLQILFHAQLGAEQGTFTIDEVVRQLADKLVRRHPHVFGEEAKHRPPGTADDVVVRWEEIKRNERDQAAEEGVPQKILGGVPKTLPALLRAYQVQARASRVGFDWPHTPQGQEMVLGKIEEEIRELREALGSSDSQTASQVEGEFGDLLFALVNLGRFIKVNPEDALRQAVNRFTERFEHIEQEAGRQGRRVDQLTLEEMDALWESAKRRERQAL